MNEISGSSREMYIRSTADTPMLHEVRVPFQGQWKSSTTICQIAVPVAKQPVLRKLQKLSYIIRICVHNPFSKEQVL